MRILIFGATGLLGKALMQEQPGGVTVIGLGSADADIRSTDQVDRVIQRHAPDWVVLAAAYTDVDGCESHEQFAWDINCTGALNVTQSARDANARMIFLSTDYVFDGNKQTPYEIGDMRDPQGVYGETKAAAEKKILEVMPNCCVVRTAWIFGMGGKCFPDTILKLAASRKELEVVDDQRGCPSYSVDLARTIYKLISLDAKGIVHATNRGECSWYEFAREIVREAGFTAKVLPTTSEKFVRPAPRPKYSVLSTASLERLKIEVPSWQDALRRYLWERANTTSVASQER